MGLDYKNLMRPQHVLLEYQMTTQASVLNVESTFAFASIESLSGRGKRYSSLTRVYNFSSVRIQCSIPFVALLTANSKRDESGQQEANA